MIENALFGGLKCGAWVWMQIENEPINLQKSVFLQILRIKESLAEMYPTFEDSGEEFNQSKFSRDQLFSKNFVCFVSAKSLKLEIPKNFKNCFREVGLWKPGLVYNIHRRFEVLGLAEFTNKIDENIRNICKHKIAFSALYQNINDFFDEVREVNAKADANSEMETKMKIQDMFSRHFKQFDGIKSNTLNIKRSHHVSFKTNLLDFSQKNYSVSNSHNPSIKVSLDFQNFYSSKLFQNTLGNSVDQFISQKMRCVRRILENKGKVILLGFPNTGKSFVMSLIKKSLEVALDYVKQYWKVLKKEVDLGLLEKMFLENRNVTYVNQKKVYINSDQQDSFFKGNKIYGRLRKSWEDLVEEQLPRSIFRWLIVDGRVSSKEEQFLEEIEDIQPQLDLIKLVQTQHGISSKDRVLNPGIQVVIETDDLSCLSPKLVREFPIVYFPPNKSQAISILTQNLRMPGDQWIYEEVEEFMNYILLPFLSKLKSSNTELKTRKVFRLNRFKTRSKQKTVSRKFNESLVSEKSQNDSLMDTRANDLLLDVIDGNVIWSIVINMNNIFQGFLRLLKREIKEVKEKRTLDQSEESEKIEGLLEPQNFVYRNIVKILCVFSLLNGLLLKKERILKVEKMLRKLCKKHFLEFEKREKEKNKNRRKKEQFLMCFFVRESMSFPENNLMQIFPKIIITSDDKVKLAYEVFDQHETASSNSLPNEISGLTDQIRLDSRISLMRSVSFSASVRQSNGSIRNLKLLGKLEEFDNKNFFLENVQTWRLRELLEIISESSYMGVIRGGNRSGKGGVLRRFLKKRGEFVQIGLNPKVGSSWLNNFLKKIRQKMEKNKLSVIIEDMSMQTCSIFQELDKTNMSFLRDGLGDSMIESKGSLRLWGLLPKIQDKVNLDSQRAFGKCCVIKADQYDDKQLKKIFELYFMGFMTKIPILINIKEKIIKAVWVILDCLERPGNQGVSISQGMNLIERVALSFMKVILQNEKDRGGSQNSFFEQESIIRILVWELTQELFRNFDQSLEGKYHLGHIDYWRIRGDLVNKRLKLSFRKKMSINLDLICGRINSNEKKNKANQEGLEMVRVVTLQNNIFIKSGIDIMKDFLRTNLKKKMNTVDLESNFSLQRIIELKHRVGLSRMIIFKGQKTVAREYLQIIRMIADHKEMQVYDADQIFEKEEFKADLLNGARFETTYSRLRLEKEFELLRILPEKQGSQDLSKNSFYSSNSENSFDSSSTKEKNKSEQNILMVKEFLLRMAQDSILNEKKVVILIDSQYLDCEVQKLLHMFLLQGEQFFDWKDKKYLSTKIFDEIKEKIRKQNPKKDVSMVEFNKEVRSKLSKKVCIVVCSGNSEKSLCLKKIQQTHQKSPDQLHLQKLIISEKLRASRTTQEKKQSQGNIREIIKLMKDHVDIFWDVPMDDKLLVDYLQQKFSNSKNYTEDSFEFEKFSKQLINILGYFNNLSQADLINILDQLVEVFESKSKELNDQLHHLCWLREINGYITKIKEKMNPSKAAPFEQKLNVKKSVLNLSLDIEENPRIIQSLMEQSQFLLEESFPELETQIEHLEKRLIQTNLICESFIFSLVGNLANLFRSNPEILAIITKNLNCKNLLVETSFHKIIDYPLFEVDDDFRNLLNFAMLRLLNKDIKSAIVLTGEDSLQDSLLHFSEISQRIIESEESDSTLEEKLSSVLQIGQTLVLKLETCSIPQIMKPFILNEFIEQESNMSVQVGNKLVKCSDKCRVFLSLPHKNVLTHRFFKQKISQKTPIIDFFPITQEEIYADLFLSCYFLKNPELREIRKKNLKKFASIYKKVKLKKRELLQFVKDSAKKDLKTETQSILFYKSLNEIIKNLREYERQGKSVLKNIQKIQRGKEFFEMASYVYSQLSTFNSPANRLWVPLARFKNFVQTIFKSKSKHRLARRKSKIAVAKKISEGERKLVKYYLSVVKSVTQNPLQIRLILEMMNFLEVVFCENNKLMIPLLSRVCLDQNPEQKLKWALNELSMLQGDLNTFADYISINSNLFERLSGEDAEIFIDRLFSNFISSFTKSSDSGQKSSHSLSSSISQQHEMYRNFDSVKLFLLKNFRIDKYISEVPTYIKKILKLMEFPNAYNMCAEYPQLGHLSKLIRLSLDLHASPVIVLYGSRSFMPAVDACLLFSRASNAKLEVCRVFAPESISEKSLEEIKKIAKFDRNYQSLRKNIQKFVENVIHQAILESRPLLLDLRDGTPVENLSFLTWFKTESFRPTSPIFIACESPLEVPIPLRMHYLQVQMSSPESLRTILLSIFSLHIFTKDSYFNLFEQAKNDLLKLVAFYSIFIYSIVFLKHFYYELVKKNERVQLDFQEISLLLADIKQICVQDFFQELILQRLKNCQLIRESNDSFFERICEYVFNVSYKSFVNRILHRESAFSNIFL